MANNMRDIQESLLSYFHNMENETFVSVVDCFVYGSPAEETYISKEVEKFIKELGIEEVYPKYMMDLKDKAMFYRTSMSERSTIEDIKQCLLSLSHNRFRRHLDKFVRNGQG